MVALNEFESGVPIKDLCRQIGVSPAPFRKWMATFGGLDSSDLLRLHELECSLPPQETQLAQSVRKKFWPR